MTKKSVKEVAVKTYVEIENAVVGGYKAIENAVVDGYKAVENATVDSYKSIEDTAVNIGKSLMEEYNKQKREWLKSHFIFWRIEYLKSVSDRGTNKIALKSLNLNFLVSLSVVIVI